MARTDIFISGVGGQGSLLSSRVIGEAAVMAGQNAVVGEIHGMSQRGGIVNSTVRVGRVYGPIISEGAADVLLGFEPLEAWRSINMAGRTSLVVVNTRPIVPATISIRNEIYPQIDDIIENLKRVSARVLPFDAMEIASRAGDPMTLNSVMLGVLAYSYQLPFAVEHLLRAIENNVPPPSIEVNKRAFALGSDIAKNWNKHYLEHHS